MITIRLCALRVLCIPLGGCAVLAAAIIGIGGCGWTYQYELDDTNPVVREFVRRCIDDGWTDLEAIRKEGGTADFGGKLSRAEAVAKQKLVEKISGGGTPTEAEYKAARCRGPH